MTREFAVEGGISAEDVPTPPNFTAQSAGEDETRSQISEWRSEVRALGLDPAAALRIVSEDADVPPADGADDGPADAPGEGSPGWVTAASDRVPEGWRPSSLFAADSGAGEREDADDAPPRDRPTGIFSEPERTDAAVERDRRDSLPGIGPGERVESGPDLGVDGDLDEHREAVRSSTGDYRGKAGPTPTSAQSSPSYQTGVNYVGADSTRNRDAFERASGEDDERPRGVFTADPEDDPDGEDDEHRPSGLFTDPDADGGDDDE